MVPIQLADIVARLDHISEVWRSGTWTNNAPTWLISTRFWAGSKPSTRETAVEAERIDELRGRIEILMDEIEIGVGIEPPAFYSPEDLDTGPDERP